MCVFFDVQYSTYGYMCIYVCVSLYMCVFMLFCVCTRVCAHVSFFVNLWMCKFVLPETSFFLTNEKWTSKIFTLCNTALLFNPIAQRTRYRNVIHWHIFPRPKAIHPFCILIFNLHYWEWTTIIFQYLLMPLEAKERERECEGTRRGANVANDIANQGIYAVKSERYYKRNIIGCVSDKSRFIFVV